jgi:hypothetical protein
VLKIIRPSAGLAIASRSAVVMRGIRNPFDVEVMSNRALGSAASVPSAISPSPSAAGCACARELENIIAALSASEVRKTFIFFIEGLGSVV